MQPWLIVPLVLLLAAPCGAAENPAQSSSAEARLAVGDKPASTASAEQVPSASTAGPGDLAVELATRLRGEAYEGRLPAKRVFARLQGTDPWVQLANVDALADWHPEEVSDYITVHLGPQGLRAVLSSNTSLGDGGMTLVHIFANDGSLIQFTQVLVGWGDFCGSYKSELVWDFFSERKIRRSYTVAVQDGEPLSEDLRDMGCETLDHQKDVEPPPTKPTWLRFGDLPVANLMAK
jgi:hypothetical protein